MTPTVSRWVKRNRVDGARAGAGTVVDVRLSPGAPFRHAAAREVRDRDGDACHYPPPFPWVGIPPTVGLLLGGVLVGPYVLEIFGKVRPIADFLAELGKLLLMFFAGLEINLALFRQARHRSTALGIATTVFPLLLGTTVGLAFGFGMIPAIVIGSLLASHTLLGLPIVTRLGLGNHELVTVAVGATVMSDTLSLVVFAICVSIYTTGFSPTGLAILLTEIVGYILLVLFGLSRLGAYVLKRVENEEDAYFVLMLSIMAIAGVLASAIQLPGIVGAFLAGLAINASAQKAPASLKLDFLSKSFFIPIFFVVTGFYDRSCQIYLRDIRRLLPCCQHCWCPARRQVDGRVGRR